MYSVTIQDTILQNDVLETFLDRKGKGNDDVKIETIKHKGLKDYFETGNLSKLPSNQPEQQRLLDLITLLTSSSEKDWKQDCTSCGWKVKPHQLQGKRDGQWALTTQGRWRLTFSLKGGEIYDLNYENYH